MQCGSSTALITYFSLAISAPSLPKDHPIAFHRLYMKRARTTGANKSATHPGPSLPSPSGEIYGRRARTQDPYAKTENVSTHK
ncbi:hypothetical protein P280DRAFT_464904 [Massarina eburnea CBS 473.64]|uniref:Uncharacterized protein n=1 Tax=Massarina eburnea CBS 473.64 TaxID=1395130 RepID=A0A6A6SK01_9PLEO|nr:hypothetical protein P280DRAFT_464904 [Massarina eburnea CBS 473.64]